MKLSEERTYYRIDESDMIIEIKSIINTTDLEKYTIETYMSPNFLRIKIYELEPEEVEMLNETR